MPSAAWKAIQEMAKTGEGRLKLGAMGGGMIAAGVGTVVTQPSEPKGPLNPHGSGRQMTAGLVAGAATAAGIYYGGRAMSGIRINKAVEEAMTTNAAQGARAIDRAVEHTAEATAKSTQSAAGPALRPLNTDEYIVAPTRQVEMPATSAPAPARSAVDPLPASPVPREVAPYVDTVTPVYPKPEVTELSNNPANFMLGEQVFDHLNRVDIHLRTLEVMGRSSKPESIETIVRELNSWSEMTAESLAGYATAEPALQQAAQRELAFLNKRIASDLRAP